MLVSQACAVAVAVTWPRSIAALGAAKVAEFDSKVRVHQNIGLGAVRWKWLGCWVFLGAGPHGIRMVVSVCEGAVLRHSNIYKYLEMMPTLKDTLLAEWCNYL